MLYYFQISVILTKVCDCVKRISGVAMCNALSVLLFLVFLINTIVDYVRYSSTLNSAPFYIWIIVDMLYFLVPAIVARLVGVVLRKKQQTI